MRLLLRTYAAVKVSARGSRGFRVRLFCRPRAVASAPVRGSFILIAQLLRHPHGWFGVRLRSGPASTCGCFSVRVLLRGAVCNKPIYPCCVRAQLDGLLNQYSLVPRSRSSIAVRAHIYTGLGNRLLYPKPGKSPK